MTTIIRKGFLVAFVGLLAFLTFGVFFGSSSAPVKAATTNPAAQNSRNQHASVLPTQGMIPRGTLYKVNSVPAGAEVVYYGIEPIQAYKISLTDDTWDLNFYMWYRWKGPFDPVGTTTFDNSSSASTNYSVTYSYTNAAGQEQPITLSNGYHYQLMYIQAGFSNDFNLTRYPLDNQELEIRFESTTYAFNQLVFEPDPSAGKDTGFGVADWNTQGTSYRSYMKHYSTTFGNSDSGTQFQDWSLGTYTISIQRPLSHFLAKLLLPLIIAMAASIMVLLLKSEHEISRLAISGTGLLTLIFLQQGYSADLPPTVPLVMMDKFYALGYLVVLFTFGRIIWETTQVFHHKRAAENFILVDRVLAGVLAVIFLGGIAALILF
jgi:hypothetical protein